MVNLVNGSHISHWGLWHIAALCLLLRHSVRHLLLHEHLLLRVHGGHHLLVRTLNLLAIWQKLSPHLVRYILLFHSSLWHPLVGPDHLAIPWHWPHWPTLLSRRHDPFIPLSNNLIQFVCR